MERSPGRRVRRPKEKQKQVEKSPLSDVTQGHEPPSDFKSGPSERCERTKEQASETKKSEKAKLETKRFSQGRKRPEGSGDSSDVVSSETRGTERYDTREETRNKSAASIEKEDSRPLSREDSVSFNENTNEKGTRYQGHIPRKNSSKGKAKKNVTVKKDEEKEGQAVKNGEKSREEATKDGQKCQHKKHEADKSSVTVADRSDTTLPQYFRQEQGTTKGDRECQTGATKQGHLGVTKRNGPKEHVISENSEKTLLENGLKMAKSKARKNVTVKNDEEKEGQAVKKGGKSREEATKDGQKCQHKKHEAEKRSVTVADKSDTTLPQHFRQDLGTTKRDSEYQSGATKQGHAGVTKRNDPVISENSGKTLLENGSEDGGIGTESTSKPENVKGKRRRSRARKKKVVGESDDKAMSQNNLRDTAAERESESPESTSVLKNKNETTNNDGVSSSVNMLSHNVELNGVNEQEGDKKGETAKRRGKPTRGYKATENVVSVSQKEALSKKSQRDTLKGKKSERKQEDATRIKSPSKSADQATEEVSLQSIDRTLEIVPDVDQSTNKTLSSTCLQSDLTAFGMAKQTNRTDNEDCDDNNILHLPQEYSERWPENESKKKSKRIRRRRRQTRSKADKHSAIDGPENALPQNGPNDCAVEQESKSRYVKDGKPGHQNEINPKKSAEIDNNNNILPQEISKDELTRTDHSGQRKENDLLRGEETSLQKGAQDGAAEQQAKQSSTGCRKVLSEKGGKKTVKKSVSKSLPIDAMKDLLNSSPEEVVDRLTSEKFSLFGIQPNMTNEAVIVVMSLVSKACSCDSQAGLTRLLSSLKNSCFLTQRVGAMLDELVAKGSRLNMQTDGDSLDTASQLVKLLAEVFGRFQTLCSSTLLIKLQRATNRLMECGKPLEKDVVPTLQNLSRLKKEDEFRRKQSTMATTVDNRRNPTDNFRHLSVIPTLGDISIDQSGSLRKNKIKGRYHNIEHYLDVQFQLLREDFLRPLRDAIKHFREHNNSRYPNDFNQDVRIYYNVKILRPICTSSGVRYKIRFDTRKFVDVQWENSKRLIFGSLLCLSKDNFENFAFATVAERNVKEVEKGLIEIRFVSSSSDARPRAGDVCQMVESIAFFGAYRPVLEGLQMMPFEEFPFKEYIVDCHKDVRPPGYLTKRDGQKVVFDFSSIIPDEKEEGEESTVTLQQEITADQCDVSDHLITSSTPKQSISVTVLEPDSWPNAKDLKIDDSQFEALQLALTKEFAIIQGPPGTGKTYIGLKIAKVLLCNQTAWSRNGKTGPMLVVCYTNHALDQFLEGILDFHPNGIIRVGGRSQSERIKKLSLSTVKKEMIQKRKLSRTGDFGNIRKEMDGLSKIINDHHRKLRELKRILFHEDELKANASSMTPKQYDSLVRMSSSSIAQLQREPSVIPYWLGLPVLPPDPYQEGFCKPRAMFPFNDECRDLEYFSQDRLASISQNIQSAQGPDGSKGGSLQLAGEVDSFIEIPNDGPLDATRSITLLAFVYPIGKGGPIICYDKSGLGVQLCYNGVTSKEGVLRASFIRRDLLEISDPLEAQVLRLNEWNFVGTSYDYNSGMARLWHNGDEVKTVYIGENLELATQFPIRIGAVNNPFKGNYFKGRISLLHIYADALTAENIRAVGGIRNANAEGKNGDAQLQEGIYAGEAVPQEEARTERGDERKQIACDKAAQREDEKNQEEVEEDEETNEDGRGIEKFKAKEKARETKKGLDQENKKRQDDDDGDDDDGDADGDDDDDDKMENEHENSVKDDVNSTLQTGVQLREKANAIETEGSKCGKDGEKEGDNQPWKSLGFQFDASIMEDNRILDTDEIIRFDTSSPLGEATAHDLYFNVGRNEGVSKSGGWQFQNVREIRKKIKNLTERKLRQEDMMNEKEAAEVCDVWILPQEDRWRLYRRWAYDARENCYEVISDFEEIFDGKANELQDLRNQEDLQILRKKDVIGMTTTGAARYHSVLQKLQPAVTIVEEAAEVFEAHTVTALTPGCQQLILIGDHQQLRPSPTVYELAKDYHLDVSLFERMIENNLEYKRLCLQHRMRPEIAKMLDHIYVNPRLQNDKSVLAFEDIKGVERNLFFVDHNEEEELVREGRSKSNNHEAKFLAALCRYLIQQGYKREQITILTAYSGQLLTLKNEMSKDEACFGGVHATVVDNFQGEENDIILLSLVRSNKIGFLKIANRVCVALSRARKGFYIIGNASLLDENDPDLWRKILTDMQEHGNLGRELKLVCQNHPQNVIFASSATHFNGAPLGGCMEPCQKRMPDCEHTCPSLCHPIDLDHKEEFSCRQPCTKIICERGHRCPKTCSEECGPCMVYVPKRIPSCGHEQNVPCSLDPSKFKCTQVVSKQAYPCGHFQDQVLCSVSPSDISCKNPCGLLECGHPCQGNCSSCQQGRLHLPCNSLCSRTLFCGHSCKDLCIRECPPCNELCKLCGHPCQRPTNEHERQLYCTRHTCTELCENPCKKQRSDQPCQKQLSCGHMGTESFTEPSTKLCQVCNKNADVVREDEAGAMFVELIDCGHVIERKELNLWMTKYEGSQDENKDIEIKQRRCPKCSTPIFCNLCNANIVSDAIADLEAVKRRIFLSNVVSKPQLEKIQKLKDSELQKLKDFGINIGEGLRETIGSRPVTTEQLTTYQNQVTFLSFLGKVWKKYGDAIEEKEQLHLRLYLLASRVMGERVCFSEQEIKEFTEELLRMELLVHLKWLTTALAGGAITLIPEDSERIEAIKDALESGKTIDRQRRKQFIDDVNKIHAQLLSAFNSKGKMVDSESSLKEKIVRRRNLTQGPWFKCVKAHLYPAAERIDGEGNIKCPECHAEAKPTAAKSQVETVATRGLMRSHKKETRKEGRKPLDSNTWRRRPGKNAKFSI